MKVKPKTHVIKITFIAEFKLTFVFLHNIIFFSGNENLFYKKNKQV